MYEFITRCVAVAGGWSGLIATCSCNLSSVFEKYCTYMTLLFPLFLLYIADGQKCINQVQH